MPSRKLKLSVTVSEDLVARIDRQSERERRSRSAVIDGWLRQAARRQAEQDIEDATIAYYDSLTPKERAEDEAMSLASSRAAAMLDIDGPAKARRIRSR